MGLVIIACGETNWLIQTEQAQLIHWNRPQGAEPVAMGQEAVALPCGTPALGDSSTAGALLIRLQMIYRPCWSSLGIQFVR